MADTRAAMSRFVLLAVGLRPFFLLAGVDAIFNMGLWLAVYIHPGFWPADTIPAMYWHSHEMLFGFVAAAIAGFLLTAVPGWTGEKSYAGWRLATLAALWTAGRVAMFPILYCPMNLAALIDLAFFPALVATLSPPLLRSRKLRNLPFVALLTLLFAANLIFHLGRLNILAGGELTALVATIDIVQILVAVVGGRIIPAFTKSGLSSLGIPVEIELELLAGSSCDCCNRCCSRWRYGCAAIHLEWRRGARGGGVTSCQTCAVEGLPRSSRPADLGLTSGVCVARCRADAQRPLASREHPVCRKVAARADGWRLCHDDPGGNDAGFARPYRAVAHCPHANRGRVPAHLAFSCDPGIWAGHRTFRLQCGRPGGGGLLDRCVRHFPSHLHARSHAVAC